MGLSSELGKFGTDITFKFDSGKGIWFTSDSHYGHTNIIRYCKRPFENAEEMNEKLIENWNSVVQPDDIVFHLGDFCFGGAPLWNAMLDRLNGKIYLIFGNHDLKNLKQGFMHRFAWTGFQAQIYIENRLIYLNHYPFLCYAGVYRGENSAWQLFGHVHSQKKEISYETITNGEVKEILSKDESRLKYLFPTQYDVGVDNNNYTPISYEQVKEIITYQQELYKMEKEKENETSEESSL